MAFGKSNENFSCVKNDKGEFECELRRPMRDGTSRMIAEGRVTVTPDCNVILEDFKSFEPGGLDRLKREVEGTLKMKCINRPVDY